MFVAVVVLSRDQSQPFALRAGDNAEWGLTPTPKQSQSRVTHLPPLRHQDLGIKLNVKVVHLGFTNSKEHEKPTAQLPSQGQTPHTTAVGWCQIVLRPWLIFGTRTWQRSADATTGPRKMLKSSERRSCGAPRASRWLGQSELF